MYDNPTLNWFLDEWIKYCDWLNESNHDARQHNKRVVNRIEAEGKRQQEQIEKSSQAVQEWNQLPWWKRMKTEPPTQILFNPEPIHRLEHEAEPIYAPSFDGFMNYLVAKRNELNTGGDK